MKKTIKLIRTYTTTFEIEAQSTEEAMKIFSAIPDDTKYNQELEQMDVDEIVKVEEELYARKCDVTGEGMNEGYVFGDGELYFKYEKDLVNHLRSREEYPNDLSDEFLLKEAYELGEYYYTEWEDESEYQYQLIDGQLVEIQ